MHIGNVIRLKSTLETHTMTRFVLKKYKFTRGYGATFFARVINILTLSFKSPVLTTNF